MQIEKLIFYRENSSDEIYSRLSPEPLYPVCSLMRATFSGRMILLKLEAFGNKGLLEFRLYES